MTFTDFDRNSFVLICLKGVYFSKFIKELKSYEGWKLWENTVTVTKFVVVLSQRLSKQVEVLVEERVATEMKAEQMMGQISEMSSEAKHIEEELHQLQVEEMQVIY